MTIARLGLARDQILRYRRTVGALDERLPPGPSSLRLAAWAGLQDSMPRAALLSLHARVEAIGPDALDDPSLVQLWGPRFSAYVVAAADRAVFTLGRLPEGGADLRRAQAMAGRLAELLGGRRIPYGEAGRALGVPPNALRYGAPTGTILMRWDGARQPVVWTVPPPDVDPSEARLDLARRYLRILGPGTPEGFAQWAGIRPGRGRAAFEALAGSLVPVRTPVGDAWILAADEPVFATPDGPATDVRLLPSGDAYWLLQGPERELLVPEADRREQLWTPRVWPGAVLLGGEIAGTWRRANTDLTIQPWRRLTAAERHALQAAAESLPLPGIAGMLRVRWGG